MVVELKIEVLFEEIQRGLFCWEWKGELLFTDSAGVFTVLFNTFCFRLYTKRFCIDIKFLICINFHWRGTIE